MHINSSSGSPSTPEYGRTSHSSGKSLFGSMIKQFTQCFAPAQSARQHTVPPLSSEHAGALSQSYSGYGHTRRVRAQRLEDPRLSNTPTKQAMTSMIDREYQKLKSLRQDSFQQIRPGKEMIDEALARKDEIPRAAHFSDDEFLAIHLYSTNLYQPINRHLRNQPQEDIRPLVEALNRGLAKLAEAPESQVNTTLYRGLKGYMADWEVEQRFSPGNRYWDEGFMSTSTDPQIADQMTGSVQLRIQSPSAVDITSFAKFDEQEALIPPNTPFNVTRLEKQGNTWLVDLSEDTGTR
jgi:hypothetical protein